MLSSIYFTLCALILPLVVVGAAATLSLKTHKNKETSSTFECGFDPSSSARIPFSMRFFMLAIIFIIFDIEVVLLMPLPLVSQVLSTKLTALTATFFITILFLGVVYEWHEGSLNWSN